MSDPEAAPSFVPPELPLPQAPSNTAPRFSPDDVTVVFVLGGPGSGKGTQSANLVRDYGFTHLSAGDLLRAEQNRAGSQYGDLIRTYIKEGKIVPMEITVALLSNAMDDALSNRRKNNSLTVSATIETTAATPTTTNSNHTPTSAPNQNQNQNTNTESPSRAKPRFLIDGFPRKLDQAVFFEETVCPSEFTLFLSCPEDVMEKRLLERGKTSGRADDNAESIRKRFRTFVDTSMPVVDAFKRQGKVVSVEATGSVDEVYERIKKAFHDRGVHPMCI